jgi:mono/diheme cytochrome c family protein
MKRRIGRRAPWMLASALLASLAFSLLPSGAIHAQGSTAGEVTFSRDIAPILQRSCQNCHRPGGVAPMPLVTYDQVRPWAPMIEYRTGLRDQAGAMPPWYMEKDIGIQHYKYDPSLNDEEIEAIAAWVARGAPEGDPADLPPPLSFQDDAVWVAGEPDLIVETEEIFMEAGTPDWWGEIAPVPIPLEEDRYVMSVEIKEVNDIDPTDTGRETVGGRYIFHHMIWSTRVLGDDDDPTLVGSSRTDEGATGWPVHEVGRNPDIFDPDAGRLLRAGSSVVSNSVHLHSSGRDTTGKLLIGFRFHPEGYEPKYPRAPVSLGNAMDIDIEAMTDGQELHAYEVLEQHTKIITFEPHLHAPGERMCLEAIWGFNVETLSCVGYDHNWVRGYAYEDGHQPLLPKGTVLHIVGYMDNTPDNTNVPDPRNWSGSGNRSVSNMFIDLGMRVSMTDEQFLEEMAERREQFSLTKNDHVIGCPLCLAAIPVPAPEGADEGQDGTADSGGQ